LTTALYLAHLNPLTNAHVEIINELKSKADKIQVMPVIFMKGESEVTSRSFPFSFEIRKKMLDSIFGDSILISRNYCFFAPFSKYMPPILSRNSWKVKKQILQGVEDDYFSYTGDKAEGYMLKIYRLKPKLGIRKEVSAASVKNKLYDAVNGLESNWKDDVPAEVAKIIEENWSVVKKFANIEDMTTKVAGMKFPKEGWSK
jgi:nicotinamide mononucleotide adenylyltransferase